jgi:hypothetical protein
VVRSRAANSQFFFERDLHSYLGDCFREVLPHLVSHGGVEVGQDDAASAGAGGEIWKPLEIWLLAVLPLRRPRPATAIHGQKVDSAVLDD